MTECTRKDPAPQNSDFKIKPFATYSKYAVEMDKTKWDVFKMHLAETGEV